jgi:hypothetical protein
LTLRYIFYFSDGTLVTQAGPFVSHIYPGEGSSPTVTVRVIDSNGMSSSTVTCYPTETRRPRRTSGSASLPTRYRNVW